MRKVLIVIVALPVLFVAAVFALPYIVDLNNWKPELTAAIKDATGREVSIAGPITFSLLPALEFKADGVRVLGADGKELAALGRLDARLAALPLLTGGLVVERMVITEPRVTLAVDAAGRENWAGPAQPGAGAPARPDTRAAGLPFGDIRLGDVRIEKGAFAFEDARTGQKLAASALNVTVGLAGLDAPLSAQLSMVLNGKPVTGALSLATPLKALTAAPAVLKAELKSEPVTLTADGTVTLAALPKLAGNFDMAIPSVGALAAWLGRPLEAGRADPGKLVARARIKSDGRAYDIEEVAVEGTALTLTAKGRVDLAGPTPQIKLAAKGGVLDIDRYLPPAAPAVAAPAPARAQDAARAPAGPLVALSNDPLDVAFLRNLEAEVKLELGGLRARGIEFGKLDFSLVARNGAIAAELSDLALYGGTVRGKVRLDAAGASPLAQGELMFDRVTVDRLPGATAAAKGPVSASLAFVTNGASPRLMTENLSGEVLLDLSKATLTEVPVSALTLKATLKGKSERPDLTAAFTYNARKVEAKLTLDALPRLLAGERFAATLALDAEPLHASFDGRVAVLPAPALDGKLTLDTPSPEMLAVWLGQPAGSIRPDAGALKIAATFAGTGAKTVLSEATLDGKALKARLSGSLDLAGAVPVLEAKLNLDQADLDAYLPAPPPAAATRGASPAPSAGWSTEPIDTASLKRIQARIDATLGKLTYRKLALEGGQATVTLVGGKFDGKLAALKTAGGTVEAATAFDGSLPKPKLDLSATVVGVEGRPFLIAFAGTDRVSGKADFNLKASATGGSEKELVETLGGAGAFKFLDGAVHGINLAATLRQIGSLGFDQGEAQKTDFAEMGGTFTIDKGVLSNKDFRLLAPLVRLAGAGTVPLPPRTMDYAVEAKLVASIQGQAGQDTLAGLPIPIRVTGTWEKPVYTVDYASVLRDVDPAKLRTLPNQAIDALRGLGIIPGTRTPAPTAPAPTTAPAQQPGPAPAPDPLAPLRNLFGR